MGTINLLEKLQTKCSVNRIVLASSRSVYGEGDYVSPTHGLHTRVSRKDKDLKDGKFVPLNYNAELWLNQMDELIYDSRNPMVEQKFLNVEDKTCFFYKHIAINHGVKSPTKRIPYEWIFPSDFSLKN